MAFHPHRTGYGKLIEMLSAKKCRRAAKQWIKSQRVLLSSKEILFAGSWLMRWQVWGTKGKESFGNCIVINLICYSETDACKLPNSFMHVCWSFMWSHFCLNKMGLQKGDRDFFHCKTIKVQKEILCFHQYQFSKTAYLRTCWIAHL